MTLDKISAVIALKKLLAELADLQYEYSSVPDNPTANGPDAIILLGHRIKLLNIIISKKEQAEALKNYLNPPK